MKKLALLLVGLMTTVCMSSCFGPEFLVDDLGPMPHHHHHHHEMVYHHSEHHIPAPHVYHW